MDIFGIYNVLTDEYDLENLKWVSSLSPLLGESTSLGDSGSSEIRYEVSANSVRELELVFSDCEMVEMK